jgi:hypothetical protein
MVFLLAVFLVSVPVFIEAPLVIATLLSLVMTAGWVWLSWVLWSRPSTQLWGDMLLGFSWSWLAGSLLGLAALGTFITFASGSDRSTVCLGMSEAQLGQSR